MSVQALLAKLQAAGIQLRKSGGGLAVSGDRDRLDPSLLGELRAHKAALLDLIVGEDWWSPPPIRPEMLTLVALTQQEIDRVVAGVPGGARNIQDIYPLAPLQEGILFHHLMAAEGDPYLATTLYAFESRERMDAYVAALQAVIDRHDILRTSVAWEGLPEPVQVVWREARLELEMVEPDPAGGEVAEQLWARFDSRRHRLDVRRAPLIRVCAAHDAANGRWVMLRQRHHLIGDHVTSEIVGQEIRAHLLGRADELPAALPFRTYVARARVGAGRAEHEEYFGKLLGDVDEPTAPFGLLDARGDGTGIEEAERALDPGVAARLRERARVLGVSAASLCHVAWAQVLSRASGRDDVVFGTVLFGRMHGDEGSDRVLGPFMNTLPVCVRVGTERVEESVRAMHAQLTTLLRHEHASLSLAQRCSGVAAPAPLFTALLNYRHVGGGSGGGGGATAARAAESARAWQGIRGLHAEERTNYPLMLSVEDLGDAMGLSVQAPASVGAARVGAMMDRALEGLVAALESAPRAPLAELEVLPLDERRQVVEEWNRSGAAYPSTACIHQLFEAQVERTPGAVAVVHGDLSLSYAELNARANRLARHLRGLGVGPDARVGLCVARGAEMLVAMLAVLKAGGAYVPLDPEYPAERLRHMLEDGTPAVVLTHGAPAGLFDAARVPVVDLGTDASAWASSPETNPESVGVAAGNLAYVIYTSGSTGKPKGVAIEHRNAVNFLAWGAAEFTERGIDRTLLSTSLNFDLAVFESFVPLVSGATVRVVRDALELIETEGAADDVTLINTVPSAIKALVDAGRVPASVRTVNLAGEPLKRALAEKIFAATGVERVCNLYGPSETTTYSTWVEMRREDGFVPHVGRPVANTQCYVLGAGGEPAPVGVVGELFIGGDGVARGYLNRPALTAERFVPDPFGAAPGARLYRTGDVARWLAGGVIEFLGRRDAQVKVRGYRIELGEIEARLAQHAAVREAVVLAREDAPGEKRLVAYVVGEAGEVEAEALRAHLSERLPEYMVPSAYVRLDALPLTPNGKLDRRALPAPGGDAFGRRGFEAPAGEAEQAVAEIWADVLRLERVGRRDHFFDLGGHSLLAVQVISRVRQALGAEVTPGDLFARPVLADFAQLLEAAARAELPPIGPVDRGGRIALSFAQARLWFLEQLGGGGGTYDIRRRLRFRGKLDRLALLRALDRIVARHETLRTTFSVVAGEPEQRIAPVEAGGFRLVEHDLRGRDDADAELQRVLAEEAGAPFDLESGPLIRGRLVRLGDEDHALLLSMHHIVSDAWSMGVLVHELGVLYGAFLRGEADPLPPLPVQYADYAAWQRRWVEGEVLRRQADYWKRTLAGAPELLELPTDHPRPARQDPAGASVAFALDEELTAGVKALGRRHGTTLFMTLLAGWSVVLSRLSGTRDVVIGTPTANRGRSEIEGMIGFFVNTLALRIDQSDSPTVAELLARVKARAIEAQHHQDIPFEQVVELASPARSLSHSPLFQVMFAWQNAPGGRLELPGLELAPLAGAARESAKFDLSLSLSERGGRIVGAMEYATALFEAATVERHLGYLRRVLEEMVAADDARRVERLQVLPPEERRLVVESWNATDAAYSRELCVHRLFEARAERAPEAAAVVFEGEALSYGEVNARANRLAHFLAERGVGPDARVAICVERGPEMVVALLAVLKAGGAYVPMDPEYPDERLAYQVVDSAPVVLLTQASLRHRFDGVAIPTLALDADAAAWAERPAVNLPTPALTPSHLAYVVYTSGSTGRPKGVAVEHRNLANLVGWHCQAFALLAGDRSSSVAGFGFDAATWEIWPPLSVGAALLLPRSGRDPMALLEWWSKQALDVSFLPTPLAEAAFTHGLTNPTLRTLLVGGDRLHAVPSDLPFTLVNNYGPTETAVVATSGVVAAGDARPHIGRPVANARSYLLDASGEPVPVGVMGELYVGGAGVARGYLGRPALTAERFVPDAFSTEPGARLYRTGDLARWLADGTIDFVGRNDFQVKVRGFRIEPGEIEARLAEHAGVREAAVVARRDAPGETRLVAYCVGDAPLDAAALRAHLVARLPEYMVPAAFVWMDALPLTPNGKVDRAALPAPEGDAYASRGYEAPVGPVEEALAGIWTEVLRVERVGRHDDFFELGGHSLRAVQVVSRVRQALGAEVTLGDLFERPVLADFAAALEPAAGDGLPAIEPVERGGPIALSFAQQRLWFLDRMEGAGAAYHIPARLRLKGELDREALRRALDRIVERHEALRTTFPETGGVPSQRIAEAGAFPLAEHDLRGAADVAELRALMAEEAGAPFDLERGPLVRGRLVRLADDDHVLLLTMHHVVSDAWSMGVMMDELGTLYGAFRRGEPDPLPPLPVQYADYAAWQRRWVEGEVLRRQADYWKRTLAGAPELLELPTDHPRPARQDHAGAWIGFALDEALTAGVNALGRRHGTTPFMTLLAAWAVVLSRLAGTRDVVIGTPTANRGRREIEGLIGFFVNTLALRVDLDGAPTVGELLGRVKARALEAQASQDIPFEQVVELAQPARSLAHSPLFQVAFTWQSAQGGKTELPGLELAAVPGESQRTSKFDLSLGLSERGGRIVGGMEYATALFEAATVERFAGYLRRVLEEMVAADASLPVERLDVLPADERRQLVEGWNATDTAYPSESGIPALVEAMVMRTPDAVAVVGDGQTVTYAALNARANRLAHHLIGRGMGAGTRVAVLLPRSIDLVAAELAVLKTGAAYVPLDASYPRERTAFMVADSGVRLLLSRSGEAVPEMAGVERIDVDAIAGERETDPGIDVDGEAVAYVMYTSGSTGEPKGVMVPHRAVAQLALSNGFADLGAGDRVALAANPAFDAATMEVWGPLLTGGRIVVVSQEVLLDPDAYGKLLKEEGVTALLITPVLFNHYARAIPGALAGVRHILTGGDRADPAAYARVLGEHGPATVYNCYGPTETTCFSIAHPVQLHEAAEGGRSVPIGRPKANTRAYVLDAAGEPVPTGAAGELYVGGAGVAHGYWNRPALTAERFVADPFSKKPGARLYRTGDLVRRLPDGKLEFVGRNDFQVKVRGFRIEPGEIETRLAEHPAVREVVVVAREDAPGEKRLVAYCAGASPVEAEALRAHLAARLPEYMVPAAYVWLDALPLTPTGKVDRRALPAPEGDAFAARAYEAPVGATEEVLAEIWAELLRVERVGRGDDFFELGGHSLLAVQVVSRVRQALGAEAALGDLFTRPVLADFARGIDAAARAVMPPIEPVDRGGRLALSFAQQRLWFLERMGGAGPAYHVPLRLRLKGALDRDALTRALDRIVARHQALRTTFAVVDGEPEQRVAPVEEGGFRLAEHDLSADASGLPRLVVEEAGAPFDLERGPLFRGRLVRLADDDHVLLLTMHHVVSDAWSLGVLMDELGALYGAFRRGEPDPLPALPVQYADYAAWQRRWVDGEVLREQTDYWKRALAGAPELLELPTDRPRPARQDHAGASIGFALDEALTAGVKALGRRHGTTPFMTLLAAWAVVLSRLSGTRDLVVGTPTANRGRREIEGLIGFFVNTLALRIDLDGSPTVGELLGRVKARALEAQHHQDIPFEQVVELAQPVRSMAHTPLFQVMFAWQSASAGGAGLPGLTLAPVGGAAHVSAKFDLSLTLSERGGRIVGGMEYATSLFDEATVERYAGYLRRVLEEMAADDARPVERLALLPDAERRLVVEGWNETEPAYPRDLCVHRLFEARAEHAPEAAAVVFEGEALSYGELNARANRLAHFLAERGVGPDARVAVCVERGPEMIAALLAVLKAGGAYVPMDPEYPDERLSYLLADSAPVVLLTQESLRSRFAGLSIPTLALDADAAGWADRPAGNPAVAALTPSHLAYVVYTSGSTGRPKGVAVEHRNLANLVGWHREAFGLRAGDRSSSVAGFGFDAATWEIWPPLSVGAALLLPRSGRDPIALLEWWSKQPLDVSFLPTPLAEAAFAHGLVNPTLRTLLVGGDRLHAVPSDLPFEVINNYGPTETAVVATSGGVTAGDARPHIGRAVANGRAYVLDAAGEPVPVGVVGELYVGGAGVARGYLGRAALTAERFVPDAFAAEPGARMYRTGDLVRWLAEGNIDFVGRDDFQVKVRGFRIELGEIEARLAEHEAVHEAVVTAREDVPGQTRLVAYYAAGEAVDADALREHLRARLPEYMVPAATVWMEALPLTPNGKVDRAALPAPEGGAYASAGYEAPVGEVEETMAEIWAELLGVERVGRGDDFFQLGGHSLLAIRLIERLRGRNLHVDAGQLFATPTLAGLAAVTEVVQELRL